MIDEAAVTVTLPMAVYRDLTRNHHAATDTYRACLAMMLGLNPVRTSDERVMEAYAEFCARPNKGDVKSNTVPVLTCAGLARHMRDLTRRAFDEDERFTGDTDATLVGRMSMLDVIAEGVFSAANDYTTEEIEELQRASTHQGKAWNMLRDRLDAAAGKEEAP